MPPKETQLTQAQTNEFEFARLGYHCKVREKYTWNNTLKKNIRDGFFFDIVQYEDGKEKLIQAGKKLFSCGEIEAIKERDKIIEFYLKKVKNEMPK